MLRELAVAFPEVRGAFEEFDRAVRAGGGTAPGPFVFPPPAFDDAAREEARRALMRTDVAQPAVGAACVGMLRLLAAPGTGARHGRRPQLRRAGGAARRGRAGRRRPGRAVGGAGPAHDRGRARARPARWRPSWPVPKRSRGSSARCRTCGPRTGNGPRQTVVAGPSAAVERRRASSPPRGASPPACCRSPPPSTRRWSPGRGSRSPAWPASGSAGRPTGRCTPTSTPRPIRPELPDIAARLGDHLANPVRFADMIEAMYRDGARVFIEVGPGAILTPMVESVLQGRPHLAVACDATPTPGLSAFLRRLARLVVAGLPLRLERLTAGRARRSLDLDHLPPGELAEPAHGVNLAGQRQPSPALRRARADPPGYGGRPSPRHARITGAGPAPADRQRKAGVDHDEQDPDSPDYRRPQPRPWLPRRPSRTRRRTRSSSRSRRPCSSSSRCRRQRCSRT